MRNVVTSTGQRAWSLFQRLQNRLKSTDKKHMFIITGAVTGGQRRGRGQRSKRRDLNQQSANDRVAPYTSPSNKPL